MPTHYQIAVLGGGPGGYVAALKAAQLGATVALVEKHHLGGTCLNYGCIPSKALLASAHLMHALQHAADLGVDLAPKPSPSGPDSALPPATINWPKVQARKDKIVQTLRGGIGALLKARKVTLYTGQAKLDGPGKVAVQAADGSTQSFTAANIILATGSTPARIPGWPTDPQVVCTSDEALHWKTLPKKLLIVGGGVIGCEFACMMQPVGVQVTIVEMLPQLLPNLDTDAAAILAKTFAQRGIGVYTGVKIDSLTVADGQTTAKLSNGQTLTADRVLVATGRRPATADLGLESVGLTTDRGFVRVNDRMATPVPGYYAIGDVNGRCLLAHAASAHGCAAVENALGHAHDFHAPIPNCVYTFPEIASVGLTLEQAQAQNLPVTVGKFPFSHFGKAMAAGETEGFVKLIRHRATDQILGVHLLGHNVTEVVAAAGALLHQKASVSEAAEVVFAHPTISEAVKEAAEDALSIGLHQGPKKVLRLTTTTA